jgi:hypothetical protein
LDNHYLLSLKLKLMEMNAQRLFKENTLKEVVVGAELRCTVYADKRDGTLWLLGGHWVKDGEPSAAYRARMNYYAAELLAGREPR